ncbi:hypothetical protein CHS0354_021936 [Potamilus streckersoni]|uniref:Uncharacterized protein n=1 Tax=Potamilus streckersoni TaxID=2493646 RepID=A0AAE0VWM9_9BIVA|nr:hypothetical protein CHS0354_021936 [Potamilus streckersoni]
MKILLTSAAAVTKHVKVVLEDGDHFCCNLNDFCLGEKSGFIEQYRTSRTQLLQWLGLKGAILDSDRNKLGDCSTPDKEIKRMKESVAEKEQNALTVYTFDSGNTDGETEKIVKTTQV